MNFNITPIKGSHYCSILHGDSENAAKLPCGDIFDKEMIETWLSKHDLCPLCRRSQYEFYTFKQKSVVVLRSSLKTLMKYGPVAANASLHLLTSSISFHRLLLIKEQHGNAICSSPALSPYFENTCFSSFLLFNFPYVVFSNLIRHEEQDIGGANSNQIVETTERHCKSLIQLGNISQTIALSSIAFNVPNETYAKSLPYLYLFGYLSIGLGALSLLAARTIFSRNPNDRHPVKYFIILFIYLLSGLVTHKLFFDMSDQSSI